MSKLPTPAKLALLGVAVVVLLVAGWLAVIAPKRSQAAELRTEIESVRSQIADLQAARSASPSPSIRVADLFNLSRAMPSTADIPGVLLQLSRLANETGITFESITPHAPTPLGAYQQIGIDLVFEGRFYDLSDFLYRLRNLVAVHGGSLSAAGRLFTVGSISFDQGSLSFPQVRASLSVSAYIFGDGSTALAPTAGATTTTTPTTESSEPVPAAPAGATAAGA